MKYTHEVIDIIKKDKTLYDLIINSEAIRTHEGEIHSRKTLENFWSGFDGSKFREIIESEHKLNIASTHQRGEIKQAVFLIMCRFSQEKRQGGIKNE
nr:MAG TPA: hypothetical protein [Caudoviricetes sp.]